MFSIIFLKPYFLNILILLNMLIIIVNTVNNALLIIYLFLLSEFLTNLLL